jgi:hypothetical protein
MPIQSSEDKLKRRPYHFSQDVKQKYGINQGAEISPEGAEETEPQEYKSYGLPSSTKYAVDMKTGRPFVVNSRKASDSNRSF